MGYPPFTLSPSLVNYPRITWNGRSGRTYDTTAYPIGSAFIPEPGIYIACRPSGDVYWAAGYVGQAESLEDRIFKRLASHHRLDAIKRFGATHFAVLFWFGGFAERCRIERDLIDQLNPPLNRV